MTNKAKSKSEKAKKAYVNPAKQKSGTAKGAEGERQ